MSKIPSLSFSIRNALDRLQWQSDVYNEEFVERLRLLFGHPGFFTSPNYGIVDDESPLTATAGSSLPLSVSANATNTLNVDVVAGMAVTLSGQWMNLEEVAQNLPLAETAINVPNVVYMTYKLVDGPLEVNDELKPVTIFTQRPEDDPDVANDFLLDVDTVDNYLAVQPSVLEDRVPLCVVTVVNQQDPDTGAVTASLSFDHTRNSYTWNRPWFSAVDIEHRLMVGTGVESINNPHRLSYNEVSIGDFGPLELLTDHGIIISKAQSMDKVPGYRCTEAVPTSQLLTDDTDGTMTGFPSAPYIELGHFPVRVGKVGLKSNGKDYPSLWVPETNRIVFPESVPLPGDSFLVSFTRVEACEPPLRGNTTYTTNNPKASEELIIAGGKGLTALSSTEETFADAHQFPMRYIMFVDTDGKLLKTPQVVYCYNRLENLSTADTPDITQYGNAYLMMGLTGAGSDTDMIIKIRVYGSDDNGNSVDHLFEFDGLTWVDPGPVGTATVTNEGFKFSDGQLFSEITSVEIEERSDDTPNSAIMIWACVNPRDTREQMEQALVVADVMWDGSFLYDVRDKRIVLTTARDFMYMSDGKMSLEAHVRALGGNLTTMYVDDMRMPQYGSLLRPPEMEEAVYPINEAYYPWSNMDQLYIGRQGIFQSRMLPVFKSSGRTFRLMMLPQGVEPRASVVPEMRLRGGGGSYSNFGSMTPVPGVPHTYEHYSPVSDPVGVQIRLKYDQFYQNHLWAIYGTGA